MVLQGLQAGNYYYESDREERKKRKRLRVILVTERE